MNNTISKFLHEVSSSGLNVIDIGSSGELNPKWDRIKKFINLIGFDPNAEECERMNAIKTSFRSAKYLPYAIGGKSSLQDFYITKNLYCYSFLEPNFKWLKRFSFSELFEIDNVQKIQVSTLAEVKELSGFDVDVIKCDTQGLEYQILSTSKEFLSRSFYLEIETGFTENYSGETTYAQIDQFLRQEGFLMFDININHRIARKGPFENLKTGNEQILWAESTWLKDYCYLISENKIDPRELNREKVLKVIILCSLMGCYDFGYELAVVFKDLGLIESSELQKLKEIAEWKIKKEHFVNGMIILLMRLMKSQYREQVYKSVERSLSYNRLFSRSTS